MFHLSLVSASACVKVVDSLYQRYGLWVILARDWRSIDVDQGQPEFLATAYDWTLESLKRRLGRMRNKRYVKVPWHEVLIPTATSRLHIQVVLYDSANEYLFK